MNVYANMSESMCLSVYPSVIYLSTHLSLKAGSESVRKTENNMYQLVICSSPQFSETWGWKVLVPSGKRLHNYRQ